MTRSAPKDRRWRIAYHEAGHAVIAAHYGLPLRDITVSKTGDGTTEVYRDGFPATDADVAWRYLHVTAAGPAAQVHFVGRGGRWAAGDGKTVDLADAKEQAFYVCGTGPGAHTKTVNRAWVEASQLVAEHWTAIESVAHVLYVDGRVTPDYVRGLLCVRSCRRST